MAWQKNGTPVTLSSPAGVLTISDLTAKKFNMFLAHIIPSTGGMDRIIFQNDTSTVYSYRENGNGTSDATNTSKTGIFGSLNTGFDNFFITYACSISGEEKLVIQFVCHTNTTGAGNVGNRREVVGKYVPSPDSDITRIDGTSSGNLNTDTNLSAFGTD